VVAHPAFARSGHPVRAERARGSASRSSARTTKEVRGNWFEEGLLPPKRRREPSLDPVRSTQGIPLRRCALRGSSARAVPARGRTKAKAERGSSPRFAERGIEAARGRCPCIVVLQKSTERPRAQRSAPPVSVGSKAWSLPGAREREPDHRRSLRRASAGAHRRQKGGGSS